MYSYKFESIRSFSTPVDKRPTFFLKIKINNRGVEIRMSWVEKLRKLTIGGGQVNETREYIHMVFTTEGLFEVATESWPEWDLNPRPLNSVQTF